MMAFQLYLLDEPRNAMLVTMTDYSTRAICFNVITAVALTGFNKCRFTTINVKAVVIFITYTTAFIK